MTKSKLIKKQVEKATKIFIKYVNVIYENDKLLNQVKGTASLHEEILDRIGVGRVEFYDAWCILEAHVVEE